MSNLEDYVLRDSAFKVSEALDTVIDSDENGVVPILSPNTSSDILDNISDIAWHTLAYFLSNPGNTREIVPGDISFRKLESEYGDSMATLADKSSEALQSVLTKYQSDIVVDFEYSIIDENNFKLAVVMTNSQGEFILNSDNITVDKTGTIISY